jgi:hypothetical protein
METAMIATAKSTAVTVSTRFTESTQERRCGLRDSARVV